MILYPAPGRAGTTEGAICECMSAPDASVALQVTPEPWTSAAFELRVALRGARANFELRVFCGYHP